MTKQNRNNNKNKIIDPLSEHSMAKARLVIHPKKVIESVRQWSLWTRLNLVGAIYTHRQEGNINMISGSWASCGPCLYILCHIVNLACDRTSLLTVCFQNSTNQKTKTKEKCIKRHPRVKFPYILFCLSKSKPNLSLEIWRRKSIWN